MQYKWTVLTNTTLGGLMSSINMTIVLISLPAIFRGFAINPVAPGEFAILLWILLGYSVVTSILLVTLGRLSDMHGRTRFYSYGFLIFTIGSILLSLIPSNTGNGGAIALIVIRLFQAFGGGLLMVNSAALITDAFPPDERGKALGINQISFVSGSMLGLILGGLLSGYDWHLIFVISVPFAIAGTAWSFIKLKNVQRHEKTKIDYIGNAVLGLSLLLITIGLTYALVPYGSSQLGWSNPFVYGSIIVGLLMLPLFVAVERRAAKPLIELRLFRVRPFTFGNISSLLAALGRGAVMFLVVIWLQGIYLPLHGISYESAPLWAGIYMLPMLIGTVLLGPISGYLTDKYGARPFATAGMVIFSISLLMLAGLKSNFNIIYFELILLINGIGSGMFASPNTTAIMNSIGTEDRGTGNGIRMTLNNIGQTLSMAIFFTMLITVFTMQLPGALYNETMSISSDAQLARIISSLPPSGLLFASFIGINPMASILNVSRISVSSAVYQKLVSTYFLPSVISVSFMQGLKIALYIAAAMTLLSALFSAMRGGRYVHEEEVAHASSSKGSSS